MPGIRTTTVGSWPIPFGKRPALKRYYAGELDDAAAGEVLQAAARIVMDEQIACGLAQIMGGGNYQKWTAPAFFYLTIVPLLWWRRRLSLLWSRPHLVSATLAAIPCLAWGRAER